MDLDDSFKLKSLKETLDRNNERIQQIEELEREMEICRWLVETFEGMSDGEIFHREVHSVKKTMHQLEAKYMENKFDIEKRRVQRQNAAVTSFIRSSFRGDPEELFRKLEKAAEPAPPPEAPQAAAALPAASGPLPPVPSEAFEQYIAQIVHKTLASIIADLSASSSGTAESVSVKPMTQWIMSLVQSSVTQALQQFSAQPVPPPVVMPCVQAYTGRIAEAPGARSTAEETGAAGEPAAVEKASAEEPAVKEPAEEPAALERMLDGEAAEEDKAPADKEPAEEPGALERMLDEEAAEEDRAPDEEPAAAQVAEEGKEELKVDFPQESEEIITSIEMPPLPIEEMTKPPALHKSAEPAEKPDEKPGSSAKKKKKLTMIQIQK